MNVLIIGSKGNMGRRYEAVCKYLGYDTFGMDLDYNDEHIGKNTDRIIIATPTHTHDRVIWACLDIFGEVPVLCEKPVVKDLRDLETILSHRNSHNLYMVNNYAYIDFSSTNFVNGGDISTKYSFYNSGNDGIWWDCIQLVHLAKAEITFTNTSPIWRTQINGHLVDRNSVDQSYISMIKDFCGPMERVWGREEILKAHQKVYQLEQQNIN